MCLLYTYLNHYQICSGIPLTFISNNGTFNDKNRLACTPDVMRTMFNDTLPSLVISPGTPAMKLRLCLNQGVHYRMT